MLLDLLRPFNFLTITHPTRKPLMVNWVIPAIVAAVAVGASLAAPNAIDVFGANGLLSRFLGFVQSLPGFYIAALAAIATFNNRDMLKIMPGTPPIGTVVHNGFAERVPMTRRRFLSSMFAYLTALSIGLTLAAIAFVTIADPVKAITPESARQWIKLAVVYAYLLLVCQMVTITLWGLYYLGDRLHTPDAIDPTPPDSQAPPL